MICPKCGEDNAENFRFCGMCGTLLEARPESRRPAGAPVPNLPRVMNAAEPARPAVVENANDPNSNEPSDQPAHRVPALSGPSILGLDRSVPAQSVAGVRDLPSADSLRENAFSGLDSFFEPEERKSGGGRVFLLLVLLVALGAAGWWTYKNYLASTYSPKPAAAQQENASAAEPSNTPPDTSSANTSSTNTGASQTPAPPVAAASPTSNAGSAVPPNAGSGTAAASNSAPANSGAPDETISAKREAEKRAAEKREAETRAEERRAEERREAEKREAAKRSPVVAPARSSKTPEPALPDTGEAEFRRGEAYLYGHGSQGNCNEALTNLRAASAKNNAKARSTLGAMYDTGHCVGRDLPTSYLWFALALRLDPNNQILTKDLEAVWNQMTPPERQMATRMKE